MRSPQNRALLLVAAMAFAGCAAYQPPALTVAHPAHPEAPAARDVPVSQTLAYSPSDVEAIRAVRAAPAPGDRPAAGTPKTVVGEGEVVASTSRRFESTGSRGRMSCTS
jgi:hypothetical protein